MLRRHWKLAAVCCALGLAGAGIHYAITPKAYQATTMIQIERRNLTPLGNGQNPWLENYWNMEFYPTQYELLQSRGLAERVVKSLDLMEDPAFNPGAGSREAAGRGASPTAEDDDAVLGRLAEPDPRRPRGRAGAQHPARPALLPRRHPRVRRQGRQRLRRGVHRHGGRGPLRHRRQGLHLPRPRRSRP